MHLLAMSSRRPLFIGLFITLLFVEYAAGNCLPLVAGLSVDGILDPDSPEDCYTIQKPPYTRELLMIDTAAYDPREGYYICTQAVGGANAFGCSTQLRSQDKSLCISGVDGTIL